MLYLLGAGGNVGDRAGYLARAAAALGEHGVIAAVSPIFETAPLGPSRESFLNAAFALRSSLTPPALLAALLSIETTLGRVRTERWGARTIDLDLLLAEDVVIDTPSLVVPHPHLLERGFVLAPLVCIAPDVLIPTVGISVRDAYDRWRARDGAGVVQLASPLQRL